MLLINDIKLDINSNEDDLKAYIKNKLKTNIKSFEIYKKSLDARKKPIYVYSVLVEVENENKYLGKNISKFIKKDLNPKYIKRNKKCIVVGYGPSGIFSAYRLIEAGYDVSVFEKGKRISERSIDVEKFFKTGILDENSNVQFGEGGAGTFSDAKLTTRIRNEYIDYILDVFVKFGAKQSIKYEHHPHIGTDQIRNVITNITDYLISKGCEFHFSEEVNDIVIENGYAKAIITNKSRYEADYILLGIGHSAYNTIQMLNKHVDNIDKLKTLYAKNKIMDVLERKITLSQIANGDLCITKYKNTKDGPIPYNDVPSFNERINAIQVLNALDQLEGPNAGEHQIIVDDIHVD